MAILLGIDTGGTFTDAVLYDDTAPAPGIVAKAKSLTTKQDLSIGIAGAVASVLAEGVDPASIGLVSISTTLATNALVEGQGGRICLILIGFDAQALNRAGLADALGADPVARVAGGLTPSGDRQAPLDHTALEAAIRSHAPSVDGFAVVAYFGTRDPEDEIAAREMITDLTDRPVTCGHELASALNGPKRALTAVLNARLIGMIARLIAATEDTLAKRGIDAPLMLVRCDGSLVSADFARARPIETILSGPAASLVGAAHLTGATDAVVSDIGGTTTDIAVLQNGRPALSEQGATVGGHSTMVEAVAMTTHGLGGDSEIGIDDTGLSATIRLGPRRVLPISLLAMDHPDLVHGTLDMQLARALARPLDGRFIIPLNRAALAAGAKADALLERIGDRPAAAEEILRARTDHASLRRLVALGALQVSGFTPSDAAHVLDRHAAWDRSAAVKAASLMARKRDGGGRPIAPNPEEFSQSVQDALVRRSAELLLDAALAHDGIPGTGHAIGTLGSAALSGHAGASRISLGLDLPLIGLGASAPLYYPDIARRLGTAPLVPADADVANAVGAVVGMVRLTASATITTPAEGVFRVHDGVGSHDHTDLDQAREASFDALSRRVSQDMRTAGATEVRLARNWDEKTATIEGKTVFIEGTATLVATGRPRIV